MAAMIGEGIPAGSGEIATLGAVRFSRDRSPYKTAIGIRCTVKDAAMAVLARGPGHPVKERDWQLEAARVEIGRSASSE
ncbi:MAG: DUF2461 domain-containing protein [Acidimicrobiia bacterium]|nr:DUF2461 domain-containing protein [Acidimicrobiia bacterium]